MYRHYDDWCSKREHKRRRAQVRKYLSDAIAALERTNRVLAQRIDYLAQQYMLSMHPTTVNRHSAILPAGAHFQYIQLIWDHDEEDLYTIECHNTSDENDQSAALYKFKQRRSTLRALEETHRWLRARLAWQESQFSVLRQVPTPMDPRVLLSTAPPPLPSPPSPGLDTVASPMPPGPKTYADVLRKDRDGTDQRQPTLV